MLKRGLGQLIDRAASQLLGPLSVPPLFSRNSNLYAKARVELPGQRPFHSRCALQHTAAVPQPASAAGDPAYGTDVPPPTAAQPQPQYDVDYTVNVKSFLLGSQLDLARLKPKFRRELRCALQRLDPSRASGPQPPAARRGSPPRSPSERYML